MQEGQSEAVCQDVLAVASVPVTIVTGFLGAGKTTLLRHVLASPHGLKIAVIQNELSASAGLEASTMVGPNGEEFANWLELANGCVCCEVREELARGIERLMELKGAFDYVLVETTGMADPGPVAEQFWLDAELESPLRLDGIVAVVDAVHFWRHARDFETCRQVGCADVILINKLDALQQMPPEVLQYVPQKEAAAAATAAIADSSEGQTPASMPDALEPLAKHLRQLNALAPQLPTTRSRVPLERILNLRAYESGKKGAKAAVEASTAAAIGIVSERPFAFMSGTVKRKGPSLKTPIQSSASATGTADRSTMGGGSWLHQDTSFGAVTLEETELLDRAKLDSFFAVLFWEPENFNAFAEGTLGGQATSASGTQPTDTRSPPTPEVFRAKGILGFASCEEMWTLQAVHSTFEVCEAGKWDELLTTEGTEAVQRGVTRLVFIGRHLSRQRLAAALHACRAGGAGEDASAKSFS